MRLITCCLFSAVVLLFVSSATCEGAVGYSFQTTTEGVYPTHHRGTVVVAGDRWRINYDAEPDEVTDLNTIVCTDGHEIVGINDSNRTWFRLKSRTRLEIDNFLFAFGEAAKVSKIRISVASVEPGPIGSEPPPTRRIIFSYRIDTKISSENVRGEVWGEIRLWTRAGLEPPELPWRAIELRTGLDSVDKALSDALSGVPGIQWQSETEVSRRLEAGETLRQVIRRTLSSMKTVDAQSDDFTVPSGYRYQEPQIGVPASGN